MDPNRTENYFDLLRTVAAVAVLLSHSFPLSGLQEPFFNAKVTLGTIAVWVFFSISGYLIKLSLIASKDFKSFAVKRVCRIFPALLTILVLSSMVAGPILTELNLQTYFLQARTWSYLAMLQVPDGQSELPGVFLHNPFSNAFNGSLWTIKYEILMYAILALTAIWRHAPIGRVVPTLAVIFFFLTLFHELDAVNLNKIFWRIELISGLTMAHISLFGSIFFMAATLALWAHIKIHHATALLAGVVMVATSSTAYFKPLAGLLLPIVVIYLAKQGPVVLMKIRPKHDISYGIYLYAFPIQQIVASQGLVGSSNWLLGLFISTFFTVMLAYASWIFIESPALSLKKKYELTRRMAN